MLSNLYFSNQFMAADAAFEKARVVLFGCPFDGTASYRPGSRFAPNAIREASWGLETYSPALDRDLSEVAFIDAGDLEFPFGNKTQTLSQILNKTSEFLNEHKVPFMLGGEHLLTISTVQACHQKYADLHVIQFDAHCDLRNNYLGEQLSHATVMRRVLDHIDAGRVFQFGIRSGPHEEFIFAREKKLQYRRDQITDVKRKIGEQPVYLTIDLDVLDPSVLPGTGTPEPGGWQFSELIESIYALAGLKIVGLDVVELAPSYDPTQVSSIVAAKIVRECLLSFF